MKCIVFFIFDGIGLIVEVFGYSFLVQFEKIDFECVIVFYIDDEEKVWEMVI